jgi:hypothetical protein
MAFILDVPRFVVPASTQRLLRSALRFAPLMPMPLQAAPAYFDAHNFTRRELF